MKSRYIVIGAGFGRKQCGAGEDKKFQPAQDST